MDSANDRTLRQLNLFPMLRAYSTFPFPSSRGFGVSAGFRSIVRGRESRHHQLPGSPGTPQGIVTILVSRRMQSIYPRAIALVEQGIIDVRTLVTHRFPLERTADAFSLVAALSDGIGRAMIELT